MKENLEEILGISGCTDCELSNNRKNIVTGEGNTDSEILLIGEAPGKEEDKRKRPFVGKAGDLLNNFLEKIGLERDEIYITNVVKCRPPSNRDPKQKEMDACNKYLKKQLEIIDPSLIISMGRIASMRMKRERISLKEIHGTLTNTDNEYGNKKLFITYHPAACLYNKNLEKVLLDDFKKLKTYFETLSGFSE